jgi:hypothetical protein
MIRKNFLFVVFFLISWTISAQCIDKEKVTYGGDWGYTDYIHRCPTYNFTFGGDKSKNWNILNDPIDIMQAPKEVLTLKRDIESKIKDYAGEDFFSRVKFNSVEVVYPERLKAFADSGRQNVTLEFCKAKYFFYYEFKPDSISTYHIGVALDKSGKIISKFNFPSKEDYKPIDTTFTYCKLIDIARKTQNKIDPIEEISFEFNNKTNQFYWLITQEIVNKKEGLNYYNQVAIDAADLSKTKNIKGKASIVY